MGEFSIQIVYIFVISCCHLPLCVLSSVKRFSYSRPVLVIGPRSGNSPSLASTSSSTAAAAAGASSTAAAKSDKINIHVSVTINASSSQQHLNQLTSGSPSSPHLQQNHSSSGTTLADLKKARSMSRHAAVPINNSSGSGSNSNLPSQNNNPNSSNKYLSGELILPALFVFAFS